MSGDAADAGCIGEEAGAAGAEKTRQTDPTEFSNGLYDHIEADNPNAALALDELLSEKAGRLLDYPHLGRPGRVTGTRELIAHPNCILVYDVIGDLVRMLRVLHAARQWPPVKGGATR